MLAITTGILMIIDFTQSKTERRLIEMRNWHIIPDTVDIIVLPADDPRKLCLGWVIRETIGIVIVNDYGISRIEV